MAGLFNRLKQLKIERDDAIFVAIDFQERLLPAMHDCEQLEARVVKLVKGMRELGSDDCNAAVYEGTWPNGAINRRGNRRLYTG